MPQIKAICVSNKKGIKREVNTALVVQNFGIENDFHAKENSLRQISILIYEIFQQKKDELYKNGINIDYGAFGENLILEGINFSEVKIGNKIFFDSGVELEITIIGKDCPAPCLIQQKTGSCIMPEYGIFCKVLKGGILKNGDCCYYSQ